MARGFAEGYAQQRDLNIAHPEGDHEDIQIIRGVIRRTARGEGDDLDKAMWASRGTGNQEAQFLLGRVAAQEAEDWEPGASTNGEPATVSEFETDMLALEADTAAYRRLADTFGPDVEIFVGS